MDEAVSREQMREYVRIWRANGPLLNAIRDREIRQADTARSIAMFERVFQIALRDLPPRPDSGLVAWQDAMARLRSRSQLSQPLKPPCG